MDDPNRSDSPRSFGEAYQSLWMDEGRARFNRSFFEKLTDTTNRSIAPLKPLLGLFFFTAYDESPVWCDNSERFFDAWESLVAKPYPEHVTELPLLFMGFGLNHRLKLRRETWGLFLTDSAAYASVSLYGGSMPRRYAYPDMQDVLPGWASSCARQIVEDFDPEGIKAFAQLTADLPDFDDDDNSEKILMGGIYDSEQMKSLMVAGLTLALDAFMGERQSLLDFYALHDDSSMRADVDLLEQAAAHSEPVSLSSRVVELGLGDYVKLGSSQSEAKHFRKLTNKFGMDDDERIIFTFTDSTLAGIYGLVVTDQAIRSRDLMEDPVSQALVSADITVNGHTLVVGDGPVHFVGEFVPERLMSSVVNLLDDYLAGRIVVA